MPLSHNQESTNNLGLVLADLITTAIGDQKEQSQVLQASMRKALANISDQSIIDAIRKVHPDLALERPKVVIVSNEGGFLSEVLSTSPIDVANYSYDIEDMDAQDIIHIPQDDTTTAEAVGSIGPDAQVTPARAALLYRVLQAHDQTSDGHQQSQSHPPSIKG